MDSLKKLSSTILDQGVPSSVIAELIECAPKTVYITVSSYNTCYNIRYVNALSKYYVSNISDGQEDAPVPGLLMDFDGLLAFVDSFYGFGLTANKRQVVYVLKKECLIHSKEGFTKAMHLLQGTYEVP